MRIIILGAMGNVGRRLMAGFPGAVGFDRLAGADIVASLDSIDYFSPAMREVFESADGVIHVATSANVEDADKVHWQAVIDTARLLAACDVYDIKRVVIPSSDWADPKTRWAANAPNAYGHSKRVFEEMAHMYNVGHPDRHCVALRIGWVALSREEYESSEPWLQANYWDDARLIGQMQAALG